MVMSLFILSHDHGQGHSLRNRNVGTLGAMVKVELIVKHKKNRCYSDIVLIRVGKSVKNSTDTIFLLEILAQKMRAKIRINVQK